MRKLDPISIIEKAYSATSSRESWQRDMAKTLVDALDPNGVGLLSYQMGERGPVDPIWISRNLQMDDETASRLLFEINDSLSPRALSHLISTLRLPGLHDLHEAFDDFDRTEDVAEKVLTMLRSRPGFEKVTHSLAVALEPATLLSPVFVTSLEDERPPLGPSTRKLWRYLTVHLGIAYRLAGRERHPDAMDVESVLTPGGDTLHARGPARDPESQEELREAVQRMDLARTARGRKDSLLALETWSGLFAGRWSLIEHYDSDGCRFVLAMRNDPRIASKNPLSLRQRQVLFYAALGWINQDIAYALGLAENTVSAHIQQGLSKLGFPSRAELIQINAAMLSAGEQLLCPQSEGTPLGSRSDGEACEG